HGQTAAGSHASATRTAATKAGTTIASPLEALERDEMLRTRWFCFVALGMVIGGGASVFFVPGDPIASVMLVCAVGLAISGIAFLFRRTNDPILYRKPSTT